jgi:hypothetical protein
LAEADDRAKGSATLAWDAATVLRAAQATWLPLPLLRFIGRDGAGQPQFDAGPTNWARLYVSGEPDASRTGVKALVVLDTEVEVRSRFDVDIYTRPTHDDVRFGSTFAFTDDAEALAPFLAQEWVQAWVERVFEALDRGRTAGIAPKTAGLGPVAAYLTLLSVLRQAAVVPSVQFIGEAAGGPAEAPVDLVVDLGTARTAAVLVEGRGEGARGGLGRASLLAFRDLSEPTRVHTGVLSSGIAFARADFGAEALSRRSGRADAFRWPSLARLGPEAERLAALAPSEDAGDSVRTPKAHIADLEPRAVAWRFAPEARHPTIRRPVLAGALLSATPASGALLPAPEGAAHAASTTVRPRFSLSMTLSFLIVEVLSQALASINRPQPREVGADPAPRRLRQVILALPLAMPIFERQLVRERAEAAIDMLWTALGWTGPDIAFAPAPPTVRLGLDETLCAQLVHLYDEIAERFGGDARTCFDLRGKPRPEFGVQPSLRVGALDLGGGPAHATIVTYTMTETGLAPALFATQRAGVGGEQVVARIADDVLRRALRSALSAAGRADAAAIVERLFEARAEDQFVRDRWLLPAAQALLGWLDGLDRAGHTAHRVTTLRRLVGPRAEPARAGLVAQAGVAGLPTAALVDAPLKISVAAVGEAVRETLAPTIEALTRRMIAADCDVLLLSGWLARLPVVADLVQAHVPWRPDRIIDMTAPMARPWSPLPEDALDSVDGKAVVLLGSLLALGGGEGFGLGRFDVETAPVLDPTAVA